MLEIPLGRGAISSVLSSRGGGLEAVNVGSLVGSVDRRFVGLYGCMLNQVELSAVLWSV